MKIHKNEVNTKQGDIVCSRSELDLGITLKGGQSFRWFAHENGYRGIFDGCVWTLVQNDTHLSYIVQGALEDSKNYNDILSRYFRLDMSLADLCEKWAAVDEHFQKSLDKTNGVRILNQDVVETVFSFICSSNNNIKRISLMVEQLCSLFGKKICSIEDKDYYSFPAIEALAGENVEKNLREAKFGYRAGYIPKAAKALMELGGKEWLLSLHKDNNVLYAEAKEQLITLDGVGPKIADCVCLMALGHLEAVPVDTHISQIAKENYLPHLKKEKKVNHKEIGNYLCELWGPYAGWAQAVVFCAKINTNGGTTTAPKTKRKGNEKKIVTRKKNCT
ncbi:N-glycosylase/DNA lyase [Dufourea novaeangliae]|uniref:DNA-(apurinic or apyrimidinic site) lyase n=2 Tax=Dufourea novaeangliae TaxID=178035 RepID=A0A154P323_DUFNO|nr:N-glycosylase/DNA lyase [Dufourea novaeangliae]